MKLRIYQKVWTNLAKEKGEDGKIVVEESRTYSIQFRHWWNRKWQEVPIVEVPGVKDDEK